MTSTESHGDPRVSSEFAELSQLLAAGNVVFLTGAGLSTDSGIPDYRGPNATPRTPMTYQDFVGDPGFRRHYWARNHVGWRHMTDVSPNAGHRALVTLEQAGLVTGIITQNVDTLHQRAGSHNVIDLHGSFDRVICLECGTVISRESLDARLTELNPDFLVSLGELGDIEIAPDADAVISQTAGFQVADCEQCGGMLKPDVVYFGETVPKERVSRAYALVDGASALVVAGSSLTIHSGRRFARHAVKAGKPVAIINQGETRADDIASLTWDMGTTEALGLLAEGLVPVR